MPLDPSTGDGVAGLLLAGGLARRMGGGDKCLRLLGGVTLLERVRRIAAPQVACLALNANGEPGRFADYGLEVVADILPDHPGPLAGVLSGMRWARQRLPGARWLATFPTDAPFLPDDLVARLRAAGGGLACARSDGRSHPVAGLWPLALEADLARALTTEGVRKIDRWTARHGVREVAWPLAGALDPFFNANRPEDLERAEALLGGAAGEPRPAPG